MLTFRLESAGDKAVIIPINPGEIYSCLEPSSDYVPEGDFEIDNNLLQYSPKEILILEVFVRGAGYIVGRALVNGKEMLCKACGRGLLDSRLERELASLQKMRRACLPHHTPIHVPQLLGYIKHPEVQCIIGLPREWMQGSCLRNLDVPMTLATRRQKWASQIRETVDQLHEMGVI
jgi:hypothetical protein